MDEDQKDLDEQTRVFTRVHGEAAEGLERTASRKTDENAAARPASNGNGLTAGRPFPGNAQNPARQNDFYQNSAYQSSAYRGNSAPNNAYQNNAYRGNGAPNNAYQNSAYQNNAYRGNGAPNNAYQNSAYQNNAYRGNSAPNGYQNSGYHSAPNNSFHNGYQSPDGMDYTPISMWGYFGYELLFSIPLVGFILVLVFSFGGTQNINLRNFARSYFCFLIVALIIFLIVFLVAGSMFLSFS